MRRSWALFVIASALAAACDGSDGTTDGGSDAALDVTLEAGADVVAEDAAEEPAIDAPVDATDAGVDAADADDAADVLVEAGSTWNTPTCNGSINFDEYGASNQTTSGAVTWYLTWDSTHLYFAVQMANLNDAAIVYVGFSGTGTTTAYQYDGTGGTLPFAADGVVYASAVTQHTRTANGDAGTWSAGNTSTVQYCTSGTTREAAVPWTALGATSLPSSFRFLGYVVGGTLAYAQIPT